MAGLCRRFPRDGRRNGSHLGKTTPATAGTISKAAANDHCGGQCSDILLPGQNGNATLAQILSTRALGGDQPAHAEDCARALRRPRHRLLRPTNDKINTFFNDAPASPTARWPPPSGGRGDVTIVRDKKTVPHIIGTTRYGTEFGAGYAAAQTGCG